MFVRLINSSTGSLIRGNTGRAGEMGANMSGYLFVTFWDIYRGKNRERTLSFGLKRQRWGNGTAMDNMSWK